jgi:NADH-quinone oxidoreductase subunit C
MKADPAAILEHLRTALPGTTLALRTNPGPSAQHSILVERESLVAVLQHLRDAMGFDMLSNVTGVDWPDPVKADSVAVVGEGGQVSHNEGFLEVIYHLFSTENRVGPLVVRARTADRGDGAHIPSAVPIFRSAEFQEREIYDLFGIRFMGHPDLRRILMWDEFVDHPMRKDYIAPDDYEYEPTPHGAVVEKAKAHYPAADSQATFSRASD